MTQLATKSKRKVSINQSIDEKFLKIKQENDNFISEILRKKYLSDDESDWFDLVGRFRKSLEPMSKVYHYLKSLDVESFIDSMKNKRFIPGGSILHGFGTSKYKNVSFSNCYYIPIENDSIEAIGDALTKTMRTFSYRGGVGISIEVLRPKNDEVSNSSKFSSGSVSFMPLFSNATQIIGQNGRRAALIISHHIDHPDVLDFIRSKAYPEMVFNNKDNQFNDTSVNISGANISVKLTNKFMQAYKSNESFEFRYPDIQDDKSLYDRTWTGDFNNWSGLWKSYETMNAKDIMKVISECAWDYGEPGVLFWDNIIQQTPMAVFPSLVPRGVNPCGEQILQNYGNCLLSSLFLYKYVKNPFSENAEFDFYTFISDVRNAVIFMNYMIDLNNHPIDKQNETDELSRKIGLGISGLGDCLAMMNMRYGSSDSIKFIEKVMAVKAYAETYQSIELAQVYKKIAPVFLSNKASSELFFHHDYFKNIDNQFKSLKDEIFPEPNYKSIYDLLDGKYEMANVALSTVAPNGTISIMANNCTSGIEPLYMFKYKRRSKLFDEEITVVHPPLFDYLMKNNKLDELENMSTKDLLNKYNYVESKDVDYHSRIKVQAVMQKYVTDSISSTINLPVTATKEDIENIYYEAWKSGLKGVTVFRDSCRLKGILQSSESKEELNSNISYIEKAELDDLEKGNRHRILWKSKIKTYVTVTTSSDNNPKEIFAKVPKEAGIDINNLFDKDQYLERQSYWDAICRLISLSLRFNIPLSEITKQMDRSSYSMFDLPAIIKRILLTYDKDKTEIELKGVICPSCKQETLVKVNGCDHCNNCGFSTCG